MITIEFGAAEKQSLDRNSLFIRFYGDDFQDNLSKIKGFWNRIYHGKPNYEWEVPFSCFEEIKELFNKHVENKKIRGLHISYGKLRDYKDFRQLDLFDSVEQEEKRKELNEMIDILHNRYGKNIVIRANSLVEGTAVERHEQIGGHRK